jgi:hypothetical protein
MQVWGSLSKSFLKKVSDTDYLFAILDAGAVMLRATSFTTIDFSSNIAESIFPKKRKNRTE